MGSERRVGPPAGGLLLASVLDCYVTAAQDVIKSGSDRSLLRGRVLGAVLGCKARGCPGLEDKCWRDLVPNSLRLADDLLWEVAKAVEQGSGPDGEPIEAVVDMLFELKSPGLIGAGGGLLAGVFEVGLEMDWLLGLPYYPGSTIKGAVRSLTSSIVAKHLGNRKEAERVMESVFGAAGPGKSRMGSVVFFDSYPVGCSRVTSHPCLLIAGGVVTPHYYRGGKPVNAEYEAQPQPVQHLVIAPGTVFRVVLGVRCPRDNNGNPDTEAAKQIIKAAAKLVGATWNDKCKPKGGGCSCLYQYASAIAILIAAALGRGFAARSGKGYNVLYPYNYEYNCKTNRNKIFDYNIQKLDIKMTTPKRGNSSTIDKQPSQPPKKQGSPHGGDPKKSRKHAGMPPRDTKKGYKEHKRYGWKKGWR